MKGYENCFVRFIVQSLENSFQVILSFGLIALGLRGFFTGFEYPIVFANGFPVGFLILYFTMAIVGGVCSLIGLYFSHKSFWMYGLERLGLYISAPAWGSYAVVSYVSPLTSTAIIEFMIFFGISLACLLHADAIDKRSEEFMMALRSGVATHIKVDE